MPDNNKPAKKTVKVSAGVAKRIQKSAASTTGTLANVAQSSESVVAASVELPTQAGVTILDRTSSYGTETRAESPEEPGNQAFRVPPLESPQEVTASSVASSATTNTPTAPHSEPIEDPEPLTASSEPEPGGLVGPEPEIVVAPQVTEDPVPTASSPAAVSVPISIQPDAEIVTTRAPAAGDTSQSSSEPSAHSATADPRAAQSRAPRRRPVPGGSSSAHNRVLASLQDVRLNGSEWGQMSVRAPADIMAAIKARAHNDSKSAGTRIAYGHYWDAALLALPDDAEALIQLANDFISSRGGIPGNSKQGTVNMSAAARSRAKAAVEALEVAGHGRKTVYAYAAVLQSLLLDLKQAGLIPSQIRTVDFGLDAAS